MTFHEMMEIKRKSYTIPDIRKMLGLGKTEANWLVHKGKFESVQINKRYYINKADFEKWYANQIKYAKIDGSPPGNELKASSYSVPDLAELLEVTDYTIYELIKQGKLQTFLVDGWMRISKDSFNQWYSSQERHRTKADRIKDADLEKSSISLTDSARQLGMHRNSMYSLISNHPDYFEIIRIAGRKRITLDSFEKWYQGQSKYKKVIILEENDLKESAEASVQESPESESIVCAPSDEDKPVSRTYYTVDEVQGFLSLSTREVYKLVQSSHFAVIKAGRKYLIPKTGFDEWMKSEYTQE